MEETSSLGTLVKLELTEDLWYEKSQICASDTQSITDQVHIPGHGHSRLLFWT